MSGPFHRFALQNFDHSERKRLIVEPGILSGRQKAHFFIVCRPRSSRLSVSGDDQKKHAEDALSFPALTFAFVLNLHAAAAPVVPAKVKTSNRNNTITACF